MATRTAAPYSLSEVAARLEMDRSLIEQLTHDGMLPLQNISTGKLGYDRAHIDYLADVLAGAAFDGGDRFDKDLIALCSHRHAYITLPPPGPGTLEPKEHRQAVKARCSKMVEEGRAVPLQTLVDKLPGELSLRAVMQWAKNKNLFCVYIGQDCYLSWQYYERLLWVLVECKKLSSVVQALGINYHVLLRRVTSGELELVIGPDNLKRLTPGAISVLRQQQEQPRS